MKKLGLLFAGQGSQFQGMGLDFVNDHATNEKILDEASKILGYDVKIVLNDDVLMNETKYTQPLVFLSTILAFHAFLKLDVGFHGVSGFSLGEYSAFYAANVFDLYDLIKLIAMRAKLMDDETKVTDGSMAAIIGLTKEEVLTLCKEDHGIVVAANFNSPVQIVISGEDSAVKRVIEHAKIKGAKRAIMLNVSGAFHSPLMEKASIKFYDEVKNYPSKAPKVPLYLNKTSKPLELDELYEQMRDQIHFPVYFTDTIHQMVDDGFTHFIEIGPGNVLSGFIRKINPDLKITNLSRLSDLENVKGWLIEHGFRT